MFPKIFVSEKPPFPVLFLSCPHSSESHPGSVWVVPASRAHTVVQYQEKMEQMCLTRHREVR